MKNYIFFGVQGSGKGTQASRFASELGIPHISTGDILRDAIADQTEEGKAVEQYLEQGELVPDALLMPIFERRFEEDDTREGFILDGFPRTLQQGQMLDDLLADSDRRINKVILIDLDEQTLLQRLAARKTCSECGAIFNTISVPPEIEGKCDLCGGELRSRSDDADEESIKQRVDSYYSSTAEVIEYYQNKGLIAEVDGRKSIEQVYAQIKEVLDQ